MFKLALKKFIVKKELLNSKSFLETIDNFAGLFKKSVQTFKKVHSYLDSHPELLTVVSKISGLDLQTAFATHAVYVKNLKPLVFGVLAPFASKHLLVLDKINYFETTYFTPAYLFIISLLSAGFLFLTNQPMPILDGDSLSISEKIKEANDILSLRYSLKKIECDLILPTQLILKDSIVETATDFDLINNHFMTYEDSVEIKLKQIADSENIRSKQIQMLENWKIVLNEQEKVEEPLKSLRDFKSISTRELKKEEVSIISKNAINGVLTDLAKIKKLYHNFEHEILIKNQMDDFRSSVNKTKTWLDNPSNEITNYRK